MKNTIQWIKGQPVLQNTLSEKHCHTVLLLLFVFSFLYFFPCYYFVALVITFITSFNAYTNESILFAYFVKTESVDRKGRNGLGVSRYPQGINSQLPYSTSPRFLPGDIKNKTLNFSSKLGLWNILC